MQRGLINQKLRAVVDQAILSAKISEKNKKNDGYFESNSQIWNFHLCVSIRGFRFKNNCLDLQISPL